MLVGASNNTGSSETIFELLLWLFYLLVWGMSCRQIKINKTLNFRVAELAWKLKYLFESITSRADLFTVAEIIEIKSSLICIRKRILFSCLHAAYQIPNPVTEVYSQTFHRLQLRPRLKQKAATIKRRTSLKRSAKTRSIVSRGTWRCSL